MIVWASSDLLHPPAVTHDFVERLVKLAAPGEIHDMWTTSGPYTGEPIAELPQLTAAAVDEAFARGREAQRAWAQVPPRERAKVFLRYHDLVLKNREMILDLIQLENGKVRRDAFLEVMDIAINCRYYANTVEELLKPKHRPGVIPMLTHTIELRHPKGVVTVISPWNYPFSMAAGDTIPALLAGNAVVQKPDNQTALSALFALELAHQAGLPRDVWQIVLGQPAEIGKSLVDNGDYLMFTGSTATGRVLAREAGERLINCSMELGGKNPMLILNDADMGRAVDGALAACFSSTGQLCVSIERMYVQDGIYDTFVPAFVEATRTMKIGAGYDFSFQIGSLTSANQVGAVTRHVEDAVAKGATVLAGGKARPDLGPYFFEPTVLADVTPDMDCFAHETFGPLVSVYRFRDLDEAVRLANDTNYGLNSSVWTRDTSLGEAIAARLHTGTVNVNEAFAAAWASMGSPMGGMGDSGIGRRHGPDGLLKYTEVQAIARQRLHNIAPLGPMSHEQFAGVATQALGLLKTIGMS